ncbi:DUF2254 domain-containing protein [Limibacillus sp. MBR-115]|uniref:DUF2254 domain-containing protein n=1 Tax=Limibacillus sp. MBR-115 TaxID=3156465 RepID=UPI003394C3BD
MSIEKLYIHLMRAYRSMWFPPAAYAAGTILILSLAPIVEPIVPFALETLIEPNAVEKILGILASSMLAVAIFSLGTMVSALQASASSATPRVRVLLTEDRTAQTAISTFIGAFIFSVLGIVGLSTGYYSDAGRFIIFTISLAVIAIVIATLISWINRLSKMGGVGEAVDLVERAATKAFTLAARDPYYGGKALTHVPESATGICLETFGYIQHINGSQLGEMAEKLGFNLLLVARPGSYAAPNRPVVLVESPVEDSDAARIRNAFVVGDARTFEEDPRFGLLVLSEIASRALSPSVNDPGTAIDVVSTLVRVLANWQQRVKEVEPQIRFDKLYVADLQVEDLLGDAFRWISRDGAGLLEVSVKVQKALATLCAVDPEKFGPAAKNMSREALGRSKLAMSAESDLLCLTEEQQKVGLD